LSNIVLYHLEKVWPIHAPARNGIPHGSRLCKYQCSQNSHLIFKLRSFSLREKLKVSFDKPPRAAYLPPMSIKNIWAAHREVRRGNTSRLLGRQTSGEVAKTIELLRSSGRRRGDDELCPTSSPAHSLTHLSSVP
jgi:hypothetical protein